MSKDQTDARVSQQRRVVGENKQMSAAVFTRKGVGLYSKIAGKPLEAFKQEKGTI